MSAADSRLVRSAGLPKPADRAEAPGRRSCAGGCTSGPACSARPRRRRICRAAAHLLAPWRTSTAACASGTGRRRSCRRAAAGRTCRRSRRRAPRRASAPSAPARAAVGCDLLAGGAVQAHRRGAHVGVADERGEVRARAAATRARRRTPRRCSRSGARRPPRMTCWRGIASTRPNRSPASTPPTCTVDSEHEPSRRSWSRRGAPTPRGAGPRAPRRRSACGCRRCPGAPTGRSRRRPPGSRSSSSGSAETAATRPSRMPRLRTAEAAPVPSNQRPPAMTVSKGGPFGASMPASNRTS